MYFTGENLIAIAKHCDEQILRIFEEFDRQEEADIQFINSLWYGVVQ